MSEIYTPQGKRPFNIAMAMKPTRGKISLPPVGAEEHPSYELIDAKNDKITALQTRIAKMELELHKALDKLASQAVEICTLKQHRR